MLEVHLVLDEFDDGDEKVGVAEPAEDIFKDGEVLVLHATGDAVAEGGEHDEWNLAEALLDAAGNVKDVVVFRTRHANHEIKGRIPQLLVCLARRSDLKEAGRIAQAELGILVKNFFIDAPVVFEHEGIIGVGDDEHVADAPHHEVHERGVAQQRTVFEIFFGHE